ncbi:YlbD family protein [Oceanobacillus sp. 1P07AA]|uniref:YlbD family protein n=1 Tax=Oceanobacillus sp. 1P07AA TaxID=3132293 RepID=UPI0039A5BB1B
MGNLDPSVQEFKEFVNKHPKIVREIRKSGRSWQEYYEKWALLGESDPYWNEFIEVDKIENQSHQDTNYNGKENQEKKENEEKDLMSQLMKYTQKIDVDKLQGQIDQLSKAVGSVQEMVEQFKSTGPKKSPKDPFHWIKD